MKKLNLFFVAAATLAAGFLTSCSKEDPTGPTVTITAPSGATEQVYIGSDYTFKGTVEAVAEASLTEVKFYNGADPITAEAVEITDGSSTYVFEVKVTNIQKDFTFKVVAYDSQQAMGEASVDVTVKAGLDVEKSVTLGHFTESAGGFVDLTTGTVYLEDDAKANQAKIGLIYYWGNTTHAGFYSPSSYITELGTNYADLGTWTTKQSTKFKSGVASDYDNATYESVAAAGATDTYFRSFENGAVTFFKLDDGRCGVVKIETVVSPSKNIEAVTFKYKIQMAPAAK